MPPIRTRFAPSPTGFLHIGGVRTALFCWLFARRQGGKFVLRIDDTDEQRNVQEALAPILHGLRWMGIAWDEGPEVGGPHAPYFQSLRKARYQAAVDELLARGAAYHDYALPAEVEAERTAAEKAKERYRYSRTWMATTPEDRARFEREGRKAVVRLKMPREGTLVLNDLIRGVVEFPWDTEQDHVVQRQDGSFIYHLANVVDDRDFEISHVLRAEEHLSNTPRQIFMVQALGYPMPEYGHLPYVAEPGSKRKLSKRKLDTYLKNPDFAKVHAHGTAIAQAIGLTTDLATFNPVTVDFYERTGYLPHALLNYLVLLGWSLDDKTEFFDLPQLIAEFSLERISRGPASLDVSKLMAFQAHYMREVPLADKVERMLPFLEQAGFVSAAVTPAVRARVARIIEILGDRVKVFGDIVLQGAFFFAAELGFDDKAFDKRVLAPGTPELLAQFRDAVAAAPSFSAPDLERVAQTILADKGLKVGSLVHAVRVAVMGTDAGPGLWESMEVLGRETCLSRLDKVLAKAAAAAGGAPSSPG